MPCPATWLSVCTSVDEETEARTSGRRRSREARPCEGQSWRQARPRQAHHVATYLRPVLGLGGREPPSGRKQLPSRHVGWALGRAAPCSRWDGTLPHLWLATLGSKAGTGSGEGRVGLGAPGRGQAEGKAGEGGGEWEAPGPGRTLCRHLEGGSGWAP